MINDVKFTGNGIESQKTTYTNNNHPKSNGYRVAKAVTTTRHVPFDRVTYPNAQHKEELL